MRIFTYPAVILASAAIMMAATGNRKATDNPKSPPAETFATIGGKKVTIEYNAPSARGRKVEGGLISYSEIYRMGADNACTLTTETDLMIGDLKVPAGAYTLWLQAAESGPWQLVVNKQTGQWGTNYDKSQDFGRTAMKVSRSDSAAETFKITLLPNSLAVEWGNSKATVPVKAAGK